MQRRIAVSDEQHIQLKTAASRRGQQLQSLVRNIFQSWLSKQKPAKGDQK